MLNKFKTLSKIIPIFIMMLLLLTLTGCKNSKNYYTVYYDSDVDEFYVDYNDDDDIYEVFIEEEQRYIYIPRASTEIIMYDENEIIVVENYKTQYDYYFRLKPPVSVKMYFYITMDCEAIY